MIWDMEVRVHLERRSYRPQTGAAPEPAPCPRWAEQRKPAGAAGCLPAAHAGSDAHADPHSARPNALRDAIPQRNLDPIRHASRAEPHGHGYPRAYRTTHCHADSDGYPFPAGAADQVGSSHHAQ